MPDENKIEVNEQNFQVLSALISRAQLMSRLGKQYSNERDIYQALGYPLDISYEMFAAHYERQDIAKAVVDRPVNASWRGGFGIEDTDDKDNNEFEKKWEELDKRLKLESKFKRVDKLTSIGQYGVLFMGFSDVEKSDEFKKAVEPSDSLQLIYVKPFGEGSAKIAQWENNTSDPRYGLPRIYQLTIADAGTDNTKTTEIDVHHSRIIHITMDLLASETKGTPELKAIYNRLMDLEKLTGGSAEMYWRGARPGYQGKVDKEFTLTTEMKEDLQAQIDEYEHNLRRILMNEGVEFEGLETQVSDPSKHVDVQIQMISAVTGIPKRILTGSERGELSSTEDKDTWLDLIQARRDDHCEIDIIRPFIDRCIEYKVLPASTNEEGYSVIWPDLWAKSESDIAKIGKTRSEAIAAYSKDLIAQSLIPPAFFYKHILGLTDDQIAEIDLARADQVIEEEGDFEGVDDG